MTPTDLGAGRVLPRSLVQTADYPPGSTFGPRLLRDFELVWVLRGAARWRVSDPLTRAVHEVELRPGTLALARPGTTDQYRWDARHPSTHAYVHLEVEGGAACEQDWPLTRPMAGHDPLDGLCSYLLDLAAAGGPVERRRSDQVMALLLDVFRVGPFPRADATLQIPEPLAMAIEQVRRSWDDEGVHQVRLADLAGYAGISSGHFSRQFAAEFGCGPVAALELVRLARAATMLRRSNMSVVQVARVNGFADAYHFSRRFSRAYRIPPGRFRRQPHHAADPLAPLAADGLLALWSALAATGSAAMTRTRP